MSGREARWGVAIAVLLGGCGGGLSLRVPKASLVRLPVEERLDLLDAENDLFAAIDRRDDAAQAVEDAREAHRRAGALVSEAVRDLDKANDSGDRDSALVAEEAVREAKLHRAWLDEAIDLAEDALEVAKAEVLVSRARFERAKAEAVKRAKLKGTASLMLADFDAQIARFERNARSLRRELSAAQARAEKVRSAWLGESRKLSDMTGGARGSPWVE
ncbi:MAG: hypothetical protein ACYCWW_17215 [Deltaproteobacteria bacterium]